MLPTRALTRGMYGATRYLRRPVMARFQSAIAQEAVKAPQQLGQQRRQEHADAASAPGESTPKNAKNAAKSDNSKESKAASSPTKRRPMNRKVRDISSQIKVSLDAATGADIVDSVDILEEGISYLREVQEAEQITDEALYFAFQPLAAKAFDKVLATPEAELGSKSPEALLDMLIEHRIAHCYHFASLQKHILSHAQDLDAHARVLSIWVKYLEHVRSLPTSMAHALGSIPACIREREFFTRDLLQLSYFSLAMQFLKTSTPYDVETVVKVLQVDGVSRIPEAFHVISTLRRLGLDSVLQEDANLFRSKLRDLSIEYMDPNSQSVAQRIDSAVKQSNARRLDQLFTEMKAASVKNSVPISEATLNKMMASYIACKNFDEALSIFSYVLSGAIAKPSSSTWELALKAMGHPSHVSSMSDNEKSASVNKIESVVRTMVASGNPVNARSLGIIVGAFSSLNRQDLVQKYLQTYKDIPVVHMTRDNILIGMALNSEMEAAEEMMKQYLQEDPTYKPSTNVMNSFLSHHVSAGNDKAVEGILNFMKQHGIEESVATTTTILNYYFKSFRKRGLVPDIDDLFRELRNDTSKWDSQMVSMLMDGLCKDGLNLDAARAVFKFFCENNKRFKHSEGMLTSMIKAELDFGSIHNAEDLFEWHIHNVHNDTRMWNMMITGLLVKRESLAMQYYQRLLQQAAFNVKPNFYTYHFMLGHFERKGQAAKVQGLLDDLAAVEMTDFGRMLPATLQRLSRTYKVDPKLIKRAQ